jgi:hypothetical protein
MTVNRYVQLLAGSFVVLSIALGAPASPLFRTMNWLWFAGFVGFMLAQASVTGFCPMGTVLRKLGVKTLAAPSACCGGLQPEKE